MLFCDKKLIKGFLFLALFVSLIGVSSAGFAATLTYPTGNSYPTGTAITLSPSTNTTTSGTYSVTTGTLPTGLTINTATGVITGTPTVVAGAVSIRVTRSGGGGAVSNTFTITITLGLPAPTYTPSTNVYTAGTAISTLNVTNNGGTVGTQGTYAGAYTTYLTVPTPISVAVDPTNGNVYTLANTKNLYKNTSTTAINSTTLAAPVGIAVDYSSNVWVTDGTKVYEFNSSGTLQNTVTGFTAALGIAIDASNNVYVIDGTSVKKIASGTFTATTLSTTGLTLTNAYGITVDQSGNIFISEKTPTKAIVKIASGGLAITSFTVTGVTLTDPRFLATDNSGNIYVDDNTSTQKFITSAGAGSVINAGTNHPAGIAVDPTGIIYSGTTTNIQSLAPVGGYFINELPPGLILNSSTGAISGTPTTAQATIAYTVIAYNATGSGSFALSIGVAPVAPTVSGGGSICFGGYLTASGGTPAGGTYTWYNASTGGSALATGANYPVTATGTYYASYTYGNEGARSAGTAVTSFTGAGPTLSVAPTNGLYLSYPFTGNTNDASTSGNNGTIQGAAPLTMDRYGNANAAYSFDGATQYISTTTAFPTPGPTSFSISVWFNASAAGGKLVGFGDQQTGASGNYDRHIYMDNSGNLYFGVWTGVATYLQTTGTNYADNTWHHVVATLSSTSGSNLYVDGVLQATSASMNVVQSYTGYWRIAYDNLNGWVNSPSDYYFTGKLDDVAIYNTALTAQQVYSLYGAGSPATCVGNALTLQANTVSGATYSWTGPNGFTSTAQNPTVSTSATTAMAGTYTLVVTQGCNSVINVTATVNSTALPVSTFTNSTSGAVWTFTYSGTYSATSTYTWDFNGGTILSGSGVGPYQVAWSTAGSKTITLTVTNSGGCYSTSTTPITVVTTTSFTGYAFMNQVTFKASSLGISSTLTNFPALISIPANSNLAITGACTDKVYNPSGSGGYDFAFVNPSTGAELPYQIENYNQATGALLVWVQIPSVSNADNTIDFYYGSKTSSNHTTAFYQSTWSGYKGVWHFSETPSTSTAALLDATSAGNNLKAYTSGTVSQNTSSLIGNGIQLAGSNVSATGISTYPALTAAFSASFWAQFATTPTTNEDMMVLIGSSSNGDQIDFRGTATAMVTNYGGATIVSATGTLATSTWHYVVLTHVSASTNTLYIDGVSKGTSTTAGQAGTVNSVFFGDYANGAGESFNGYIDEARVTSSTLTSDWVKAEYANQLNPATYTTFGGTTTVNTTYAAPISGALTYTWTGATSTDPTVATNWTNTTAGTSNQAPAFDGTATLVIPAGLVNYPALSASESLYGLTIASGAYINLNGYTLTVGCNIYNSSGGQILYNSNTGSGLTFASTVAQTYTGSNNTDTFQVGNLTINNTVGVTVSGGPLDVYNSLSFGASNNGKLFIGSSPAALTLKSTATATANVGQMTSSSITGPGPSFLPVSVNVERFISGGAGLRGYRLLSSPVYGSTAGGNNIYSVNYIGNSCFITGTTVSTTLPGIDRVGNPTLYLFRENIASSNASFTSGNFRGIGNMGTTGLSNFAYGIDNDGTGFNIPVGNGVLFFFRGDRNATGQSIITETNPSYVPTATTLTTSGTLNTGTITYHPWFTPASAYLSDASTTGSTVQGYNLMGNPYPSAISWDAVYAASTGIGASVYQYNPSNYQYSAYVQGTPGGLGTGGASNVIESGQGFFAIATGTTSAVVFKETEKVSSQASTLLFNAQNPNTTASQQYLHLKMVKDSLNYDDVIVIFKPGTSAKYSIDEDAKHITGNSPPEALTALSSDSVGLSINYLPLQGTRIVVGLNATATASGKFTFSRTDLVGIPAIYNIWLKDNMLKDSIDLRANTTYTFLIDNSNPASYGPNRFQLVFSQNPALSLHLLNFVGSKVANAPLQSQLSWTVENESNYTTFILQRSTDGGKTFSSLGSTQSDGSGTYTFVDKNPVLGEDMYRLQLDDLNGNISYSQIITLQFSNLSNSSIAGTLSVYPNPAHEVLNVSFNAAGSANAYSLLITSSSGTVVKRIDSVSPSSQQDVSSLTPGTYYLTMIDNGTKTVVAQSKFVKL